jgi:hypothetical protein
MDKLSSASRAHTELGMMDGTTLSYTEMILRGEQPQPRGMQIMMKMMTTVQSQV